jgi:IS5 family transposase
LTSGATIRHRGEAARICGARYAAHAVSLTGGAMVRRAYRQRSLVEVLLPDGDKLWDSTLRQIDTVLDDEVLVDRVADALAQRHPQSRRRGRLGTPATVVLRMLVLKHLFDWSFDECEREVRGSLVYRAFCRIDGERVPDAKTLIRLAHLLDEAVLKDLLARLVALGRERRVVRGRRLRVDTTVVETNIHYPTDATLLADGVRLLTRGLRRLGERVRERARSGARRVFEIAQRSRTAGHRVPAGVRARSRAKMKCLYRGLLRITRTVMRQAEIAVARARGKSHAGHLATTLDLVRQVLAQTRARGLRGDTHYPGTVVSLFEPHTDIIRKGKLTKPTEFGRVVKIQEAEAQFITDYAVCERRQADRTLWGPALDRHIELFGGPPQLAVADGGFASATNERAARERGVRHVVLPRQSRDTRSRRERHAAVGRARGHRQQPPGARPGRAMNRWGSRIDAMYAVERKGAEMSIRTLARAFIVQLTATSVSISAPESS